MKEFILTLGLATLTAAHAVEFSNTAEADKYIYDKSSDIKWRGARMSGGYEESTNLVPFKTFTSTDDDCVKKQLAQFNTFAGQVDDQKKGAAKPPSLRLVMDPRHHDPKAKLVTWGNTDYKREDKYYSDVKILDDGSLSIMFGINKWGDCKLVSSTQMRAVFDKGAQTGDGLSKRPLGTDPEVSPGGAINEGG